VSLKLPLIHLEDLNGKHRSHLRSPHG